MKSIIALIASSGCFWFAHLCHCISDWLECGFYPLTVPQFRATRAAMSILDGGFYASFFIGLALLLHLAHTLILRAARSTTISSSDAAP